MEILLKIISGYLLADFFSGLFHWYEDVLLNPDEFKVKEGLLYEIAVDNKLHHTKPRKMISSPWYKTIEVTCYVTIPLSLICYLLFGFHIIWLVALLLGSFLNQIHKWQHMTIKERPLIISWLMVLGIFAGQKHHSQHHKPPYRSHYCILSPYLNPLLDKTHFWDFLEKCLS